MAGEFLYFGIYVLQQMGIMLGVGAQTVLLCMHLIAVHHAEQENPHASYAHAARFALGIGLFFITISGIAAVLVHLLNGQLDIILSPAFLFKWVLIALLVSAFAVQGIFHTWGGTYYALTGGTWYALFLVHSLGPVTSWLTLWILYVLWLIFFCIVWGAFTALMRWRLVPVTATTPAPVIIRETVKPVPISIVVSAPPPPPPAPVFKPAPPPPVAAPLPIPKPPPPPPPLPPKPIPPPPFDPVVVEPPPAFAVPKLVPVPPPASKPVPPPAPAPVAPPPPPAPAPTPVAKPAAVVIPVASASKPEEPVAVVVQPVAQKVSWWRRLFSWSWRRKEAPKALPPAPEPKPVVVSAPVALVVPVVPKPIPPPPPPAPKPVPPPAPAPLPVAKPLALPVTPPAPVAAPAPKPTPVQIPVPVQQNFIQDVIDHLLVPALHIMPKTPEDIGKQKRPPVVKLD